MTQDWKEESTEIINNAFQVVVNYCRNPSGETNVIVQEGQKIEDFIESLLKEEREKVWEEMHLAMDRNAAHVRNAVLSDLETMLDDAIFHCNATGSSGESVMAYQSAKTLVNNLRVK